jgi:hypothetical protein
MQSASRDVAATTSTNGWPEADQEVAAPPYNTIMRDSLIPYQVATMGRLVLPPGSLDDQSSRTLPAVLRRMRLRSENRREIGEGSCPEAECRGPPADRSTAVEARRPRDRNGGYDRGTDSARLDRFRGDFLTSSDAAYGISMRNRGGGDPDHEAVSAGEIQETNRGASPSVAPAQQQPVQHRYSYLSQSDFLPGT